ncbi:2OG-Fe(II) oxygenase family protein [Glaciimonas sp. GG7]
MHNFNDVFKKNGYVVIDISKLFGVQLDEILRKINLLNNASWKQVINHNGVVQDIDLSDQIVCKEHQLALQKMYESEFSYSFKRIVCEGDDQFSKAVKNFLLSTFFSDFLYSITKIKFKSIPVLYINAFANGDFLTTHCDAGLEFGIIISLTKEWDVNFGGLTFILDLDRKNIIDIVSPGFAKLIVFDTKHRLAPHFVSMVSCPPDRRRMSIVARFDI